MINKKDWLQKTPLSSKKFIMSAFCTLAWLLTIIFAIKRDVDQEVLLWCVHYCGLCQLAFLGGQSLIDTVVRSSFAKYGGNAGKQSKVETELN